MKEVTYEDWALDPTPRMMWVWDDNEKMREKRKVVYISIRPDYPIVALSTDERETNLFMHCAEIEESSKTRRMTNKEFTSWLLEGIREGKLRQWRRINSNNIESVPCGYTYEYENLFVENKLIREDGGEWREPLVETDEYKDYLESEKAYNDGV